MLNTEGRDALGVQLTRHLDVFVHGVVSSSTERVEHFKHKSSIVIIEQDYSSRIYTF